MASREQQVFAIIREDPMTPQQAIADQLGITRSAVAGHIMNLTKKGLIKGRGYVIYEAPFVAIAGGANIDIHGRSAKSMIPHDSNPGEVHIAAGGVARNVAENLARLGIDARLISVVGGDQNGRLLLRLSREAGVDVQHVQEISAAKTSTYLSVLDDRGEMLLAVNDMQIMEQFKVELLQSCAAMLKRASLIVVDANLPNDTLAWLIKKPRGIPVFADTVSTTKARRLGTYLAHIHTLKTGTIEVEALTGLKAQTSEQLRKVASMLHKQGVLRVFITRGDQGVFYSTGDVQGTRALRCRQRGVANAGGAGDAFLAGLVFSWLQKSSLSDSVEFALAAASVTLSHAGTNHPELSATRVHEAMESQHA